MGQAPHGPDGVRVMLTKTQEWEWVLGDPRSYHCPFKKDRINWVGQRAGSSWREESKRSLHLWGREREKSSCVDRGTLRICSESALGCHLSETDRPSPKEGVRWESMGMCGEGGTLVPWDPLHPPHPNKPLQQ